MDILQDHEPTGLPEVVEAGVACRDQEVVEGEWRSRAPAEELVEDTVAGILGGRPIPRYAEGQGQHGLVVLAIERLNLVVTVRRVVGILHDITPLGPLRWVRFSWRRARA